VGVGDVVWGRKNHSYGGCELRRSTVVTSNTHTEADLDRYGTKGENRDRLGLQTIHHRIITHYDNPTAAQVLVITNRDTCMTHVLDRYCMVC
jgi:hypothetical protein